MQKQVSDFRDNGKKNGNYHIIGFLMLVILQ